MKNHFFISYFGNKRQEVERIYNNIPDFDKYNIIVEPYCGSSAFSYYVWLNNKNKNLSYVLNDNNKFIIELYSISKNIEKFNILYNDIIKIQETTTNKDLYKEVVKKAQNDLASYIYINKVYSIRVGLYPINRKFTKDSFNTFLNAPIIEFLRTANITIRNEDALKVYDEYKGNDKAIIFLDPPYLISNNSWYNDPKVNIYEYLFNNDILKEKALIILCLENIWIIKLLFKGKKTIVYDKKYQTKKKLTEHIIILNKNA